MTTSSTAGARTQPTRFGPADRTAIEVLLAAFALTRFVAHASGMSMDASPLDVYVQVIDRDLLTTRWLESLWYAPGQPPLWNALLGLVLRQDPTWHRPLLEAMQAGFGLVLTGATYALLRRLRLSPLAATLGALVMVCNPVSVLYESWLFYSHATAALLVLSIAAFAALLDRPTTARAFATSAAFSLLALLRASWHVAFLLVPLALAATRADVRARGRSLLAAAILPALLPALFYAKNAALYGTFSGSTWLGMNLARVVQEGTSRDERAALVAEGVVSPLALEAPFAPLASYDKRWTTSVRCPTGIPVLSRESRRGGAPNLNHCGYVSLSRQYAKDSLALMRARPAAYLGGLRKALQIFALPPSENGLVRGNNRDRVPGWMAFYEKWVGLVPDRFSRHPTEFDPAMIYGHGPASDAWLFGHGTWGTLLGALVSGVILGANALARLVRRAATTADVTTLLVALSAAFGAFVGLAFELGENNRFRWEIEPLLFVLVTLGVARVVDVLTRGRGHAPA